MLTTLLAAFGFSFFVVKSHSWVRCTKYNAEITGIDYSEDECDGWIRGWDFDGITFAQDRGINYQVGVGSGQNLCQSTITSDLAASSDKIPTYVPGSTIRVVWPAKNHANYECFNFIPDTSMKLFVNPNPNPTSDLPNTASTMENQGYTEIKDWQENCNAGDDGCGFQNCPKFCENTDAATCFGDFVVPTDVFTQSGHYTFVWYWIFNPGSPYISCYEAYVDVDATEISTPDDESGGSSDDSGSINGYIVQMPVCIDGQDYDISDFSSFVEDQFSDIDSSDIGYLRVSTGTNAYNVTAQFELSSSEVSSVTTTASEDFCDNFESEYSGTTCDNCADVITFAQYESSASINCYLFAAIFSIFMVFWNY